VFNFNIKGLFSHVEEGVFFYQLSEIVNAKTRKKCCK